MRYGVSGATGLGWLGGLAAALLLGLLRGPVCVGQTGSSVPSAGAAPAGTTAASQPAAGSGGAQRVDLDHVVAVVNGDLILESDLDEEQRFAAFQPFHDSSSVTRDQLINRLIDRDLILQQAALQPQAPITDAQVDAELASLRKNIPECAKEHCETDAGWQTFVAEQGFTLDELREHWRQRMEVLRFIEARFRMGIRIPQSDIDAYYNQTLAPAYAKQNATPPAEKTIADKIQEILLQQQVGKLMDDWLTSLRAQGSVRVMKQGEATP